MVRLLYSDIFRL